jgi:hypothetical protein
MQGLHGSSDAADLRWRGGSIDNAIRVRLKNERVRARCTPEQLPQLDSNPTSISRLGEDWRAIRQSPN